MALLFFFFSSNLWSIYASMLFYVSRDHHHFSYGKGSSKLQIFTLPHTDPARLICRKSLRCATNKSTKNLGCASAILSILAGNKSFRLSQASHVKYNAYLPTYLPVHAFNPRTMTCASYVSKRVPNVFQKGAKFHPVLAVFPM